MKQNNNIIHPTGTLLAVLAVLLLAATLIPATTYADEYAGKKASLWRDNSSFTKMYKDSRANAINDIVTIQVSETTTASNKAGLSTNKKTSVSMGIDKINGLPALCIKFPIPV